MRKSSHPNAPGPPRCGVVAPTLTARQRLVDLMTSRRHMLVLAIVFVLVTLVPTGVSFAQAPAADGVIPDEWIVTFAAPANPNGKALGLTRAHGGQVRHVYSAALNGFSFRGPAAAAAGMARSPLVRSVVPNRAVQATTAPPGVQRIDASHPTDLDAHDYSTGTGIGIAILDTGVGPHTNLDIVGNMGANCMSNPMDPDVGAPVADDNGHGTHAAGSAAGNGNGVIGVAPDAELVAVKVLDQNGSGSWATVICGIDYVTANSPSIQVANMSLSGPGSATSCTDGGLHQALCNSVAAGVVYTIAAGNSDIDAANEVPAAYGNDLGLITTSAYADYDGEPGRNGGCLRFFGLGRQCDDTFAKFSNRSCAFSGWGSKKSAIEGRRPGGAGLFDRHQWFCLQHQERDQHGGAPRGWCGRTRAGREPVADTGPGRGLHQRKRRVP